MAVGLRSLHAGCQNDNALGPASCIRSFDFTLAFEQSVFSILPSAIVLLAAPPIVSKLLKKNSRTTGYKNRSVPQNVLATSNVALQFALVILWSLSPPNDRTPTSVPSAVLSLMVAMTIIGLLHLETYKATRPSTLIVVYLLFSVVFDATQIRTLWLAHHTTIAAVQAASAIVRLVLLVSESRSKVPYLILPYRDYPPEAQVGILNLSFVWWINKLFTKGFRVLITSSDLFPLHPRLNSAALACFAGQSLVAKTIGKDQQKWNRAIQIRVKNTSHMLSSLRNIKLSGHADVFHFDLQEERRQELRTSGPFFMGIVWLNLLAGLPTVWSPVVTFIVYAIQARVRGSQSLTTVQAFTSLSIITLLTSPASKLLALLSQIAAAMGCFGRIEEYLFSKSRIDNRIFVQAKHSRTSEHGNEKSEPTSENKSSKPLYMVKFEKATISPAHESKTTAIKEASITIPKASLTVLVGPVGSGKTTLLKAMLGELNCQTGSVSLQSSRIAYCSQASFILNDTVKNNICGPSSLDIDETWYQTVISACDLGVDIQRWTDGDKTIVGSKGLKLSGGQRQRLALARAIYARRDLILLDDTMSALDGKTQGIISDNLFSQNGVLRRLGTTVIWATHHTQILPIADHIIVLDQEGNIRQVESPEVLLDSPSKLLSNSIDEDAVSSEKMDSSSPASPASERNVTDEKLMDLTRRTGDFTTYFYYFRTIGWSLSITFLTVNAVATFTQNFPQIWLKWWAAVNGNQLSKYLPVYTALAISATLSASVVIWIMFLRMMPKSAAELHKKILDAVIEAPLSFIVSTDSGVTLNRFSQDMSLMDLALPIALLSFVMAILDCLVKVSLIATGSSYMAITLPFTFVAIFFIQLVYLRTSRQLRHLDLENKSPLYSHLTETLEGLATIRAFGWERYFVAKQSEILDHSQKPYYMLLCAQRWLTLVLDLMVTALAVIVVALAVSLRSSTSVGLLGIALNNILSFNQSLSSLVTSWTSLETSLGAIARVKVFVETIPSEVSPVDDRPPPPPEWPENGALELRNVSIQYDDENYALKGISMMINAGQKVGICGRTGSGKSTLILSLLRLISPSAGSILIDGIDISSIRPSILRRRLTTVPQDPLTMTGTIRSNVDPFGEHPDTEIISVATEFHIWSALENRGGLDATLLDQPLSQGEQQLLCLARAALRKSSVLILDEATSSLDDETDRLIQKVIKQKFADCTVICVAHRTKSQCSKPEN
ncbi:hypothetical protein FKW77_008421 [Venturia effusa]|uniref:ABC transporter domain-containing protein n=1 Tax=Venturia effusa TaxID=50376 RepID=A0A517L9S1_9PEZI|nr:hypothetical protein FKW77_008421 [Venturia effusa]